MYTKTFKSVVFVYTFLILTATIKSVSSVRSDRKSKDDAHLCLNPTDEDVTHFLDHQPPTTIPPYADRIYSVNADMHITQALVVFVCQGPPSTSNAQKKLVRAGHPFYSDKTTRYFSLASIPDDNQPDTYKGRFCELRHKNQPIWFPSRLDPQNQTVVCATKTREKNGPRVILERNPVTGNMAISHGLMHKAPVQAVLTRKFEISLYGSATAETPIHKITTNPFSIDPPVKGVSWITQIKNVTANQPFEIELQIVNETNERIITGFGSTLMVEVTLSYDLKTFYKTSLKAGFLSQTRATLAGKEVKISKRNNDRILQKRAVEGYVKFTDLRILEETGFKLMQFQLNATLMIPRGFWNRVPNDYSDLVCLKKSQQSEIDIARKSMTPRLYIEGSYPWELADTEKKEFYTYDPQCKSESKAVKLTPSFRVNEQNITRLDLYENYGRIKNATFSANFHIENITYVAVDDLGERIFTGKYHSATIDVTTDPPKIAIHYDKKSDLHEGSGTFHGSIVQIAQNVSLCFTVTVKGVSLVTKNCTKQRFNITGDIHMAVFGHLKSTGVFSHPDPLIETFARFAVEDINDRLGEDMLKDYLPVLPKDRKLFIKGYDTKLDLYTTTSKFRKLSILGQKNPSERVRAIIGFMSDSLTADLYPLISRDRIILIGVREQEYRNDTEFFVRLAPTAAQYFEVLGKFLQDRKWKAISVLRSDTSDLDKTFFDAMKKYGITIVADIFVLQRPEKEWNNETYHKRLHTLPESTKIVFCYIRAPAQYMVLRQAIRFRKSSMYGFQWIMLGIPGLEFPFINSHPICRIKGLPTCTEGMSGTIILQNVHKLDYTIDLWQHVHQKFFEMDRTLYRGVPKVYPFYYVSQYARGYDAVISFVRAINQRIQTKKTIHMNEIAEFMRHDEFEGLTGKIVMKEGNRQDFVASMISIKGDTLHATEEIVTAQMCRNLTIMPGANGPVLVETLQQSEYEVKSESEIGIVTLPTTNFVEERRFFSRAGIVSRRDQSLTLNYKFDKIPQKIVEICIHFESCQPWTNKSGHIIDPNTLVKRLEIIPLPHYCENGCGGNKVSNESANEYEHGRCISQRRCLCKTVAEVYKKEIEQQKIQIHKQYWNNKAHAGPTCSQAVCQKCEKGYCFGPQLCRCLEGYTGAGCDQAVCEGGCGIGVCESPNNCKCPPGLVGPNCEIILTVLVGPLVVLLFLMGCFSINLFYRWKKRAEWHRLLTSTDWLVKWEDVSYPGQKQSLISGSVTPLSGRSMSKSGLESLGSLPEGVLKNVVIWHNQKCYMTRLNCESVNIAINEIRMEIVLRYQMNHANVVPFNGLCADAPFVSILTEFYPKGSLEDVLSTHKVPLDWDVKFSMLKDIAKGMEYIHESNIGSHGRLKSSNCLMDNRWSIRIGGFGVPTIRKSPRLVEEIFNPAEFLWTAPELLRQHEKLVDVLPGTKSGDAYSFGIIITELCTEDQPYALERNVLSAEEVLMLLKNLEDPANRGLRTTWISYGGSPTDNMRPAIHKSQLPQDPHEQRGLLQLMTGCWKEYESLRPTFKEIISQMNNIKQVKGDLVDILIKRLEQYSLKLEEQFVEASKELQTEKERLEELLGRLLPKKIVEDMIHGKKVEAEQFEMVTVCFSDISDFVSMAKGLTPYEVINLLNALYMCFDSIIENFDVYKVETVRDEYMVVSGLPIRNGYMHASEIAMLALHLMAAILEFDARYTPINGILMLRIGMHSGPCVAGVVGLQMPRYCLFGDTINTASRMKSSSSALQIHMSEATANTLKIVGGFQYEYRGEREVKGRGKMKTYWLKGADNFTKPLPNPKLAVSSELQTFK